MGRGRGADPGCRGRHLVPLTGRALRPVGPITSRVGEITSGTLDGRVPEPGTSDEIGVLAQTMNRMLSRLELSDRQRRQFVSEASHELRTPVAVLRSEAEAARTRRLPVDLSQVSAGRVRGRPDDLARAVGHLLDNAARHGESGR